MRTIIWIDFFSGFLIACMLYSILLFLLKKIKGITCFYLCFAFGAFGFGILNVIQYNQPWWHVFIPM